MTSISPAPFDDEVSLKSLGTGYRAVVVGSTGGIGAAVANLLDRDPLSADVLRLGRRAEIALDLEDESSIEAAAAKVGEGGSVDLLFDATGILHDDDISPEKALRSIDGSAMARVFAINATGPALLLKHFHRLFPRKRKCVAASLSARVGSIGDNRAGGWYAYRASKAALNMLWRSGAIEVARLKPEAACIVLHPGTVATPLSAPFAGNRATDDPDLAARRLLGVVEACDQSATGGFFAYDGSEIPW